MRIAILGSRDSNPEVEPFDNETDFERVCSELGRVLSGAAHTLIVESDRERTADMSVVNGVRQLDPASRGPVEVWHRTKAKAGTSRPRKEPFASDSWIKKIPIQVAHVGSAHVRMLSNAHMVVVIGGGSNAYLAGQTARALDVRLLPVAAFGGAGRLLWQEVSSQVASNARTIDERNLSQLGTLSNVVSAIEAEVASLPRIMIVHGRSDDKDEVARLLRLSGAASVVMQDDSTAGETIPTEFERLARQADGAVVVITPDDEGRIVGGGPFCYRARQNVVLEYGWFWCRFGRKGVALLLRGDVELPSDVLGVLYHRYESTPAECESQLREFVKRILTKSVRP
jgi:predicted nucleotide-binding protein